MIARITSGGLAIRLIKLRTDVTATEKFTAYAVLLIVEISAIAEARLKTIRETPPVRCIVLYRYENDIHCMFQTSKTSFDIPSQIV